MLVNERSVTSRAGQLHPFAVHYMSKMVCHIKPIQIPQQQVIGALCLLTSRAFIFNPEVLVMSRAWVKKCQVRNRYGTVLPHLTKLRHLDAVVCSYIIAWRTDRI